VKRYKNREAYFVKREALRTNKPWSVKF